MFPAVTRTFARTTSATSQSSSAGARLCSQRRLSSSDLFPHQRRMSWPKFRNLRSHADNRRREFSASRQQRFLPSRQLPGRPSTWIFLGSRPEILVPGQGRLKPVPAIAPHTGGLFLPHHIARATCPITQRLCSVIQTPCSAAVGRRRKLAPKPHSLGTSLALSAPSCPPTADDIRSTSHSIHLSQVAPSPHADGSMSSVQLTTIASSSRQSPNRGARSHTALRLLPRPPSSSMIHHR
ncbi:hypothetical protein B0H10DRAFT_1262849 [Mycena sp. CBHHK59/15]|nr:hypothetical protein B0H10DRAFT_1262849 [Mycena sp. CBHHK59/15]